MVIEAPSPGGGTATQVRRLLVVNPNGNVAVNDLVREAAARVLGPTTTARVVNPRLSPLSIETLEDRRRAEPLALELLSQHRGYDAYVMACFDDIAVDAGRRFLGAPVVGAAEAAIAAARLFAGRFAIVTTVEAMVPGIRALIEEFGVSARCTVRAAGVGVAAAAGSCGEVDARIDDAIVAARNVDGAGAVILGSGGLTGRASELARRHAVPVIDAIESAVLLADAAARLVRPSRGPIRGG